MTGCHYKKHLQAPHLHSPARCNPLLAFRKMPVPPWSCSRRQPALPLLAGAAAILCHPSSPPAAGFQGTMFLSAEQEKQLFVSVLFLFCLFFVYQHTQKSSVIAKKKKTPSFAFLSEGHQEHLVIQPTVLCIHCHKIPTRSMNRQSKIQIKPKKTFKMQSLSQFCSKSYSTYHIYLVL